MKNKTIDSLKKLGLSTYEANVYLAMTYMISGTATEISSNSNVPRTKIYDVLKSLAIKEFVEIDRGRPLKYNIVPPSEVFRKYKQKILEEFEETELELNYAYESQLSKIPAPIWLIHGPERIIKKETEIISRAKKTLSFRMGFLFEEEANILKEKFKKILKRGVEINILATEYCYIDNKKIDVLSEFEDCNVNILKADVPFVKLIVRDSSEMIHIFSKFSGKYKNVVSNSAIGVWNQYEDIAKNYDDRFFNALNKKMRKRK
jgi:HTH-type transcriptional regulator, sugar sensing transcriptional regulator